jgi:hypothetical protein
MSKKIVTNFLHVHLDILCSHTNFWKKKNICCVMYKKEKFAYEHMTFQGHIFLFLPMPHKKFSFVKNLCADIKCPDLHVIFFKKRITF